MADESTNAAVFGFTASTAAALLADLRQSGNTQRPPVQQNVFNTHIRFGKTVDAIAVGNTPGTVTLYGAVESASGWAATSETFEAYTWPTALEADTYVACFAINGRWACFALC